MFIHIVIISLRYTHEEPIHEVVIMFLRNEVYKSLCYEVVVIINQILEYHQVQCRHVSARDFRRRRPVGKLLPTKCVRGGSYATEIRHTNIVITNTQYARGETIQQEYVCYPWQKSLSY